MTTDTQRQPAIVVEPAFTCSRPAPRRELTPEEEPALWDRINDQLYRERRLRPPRGYNSRGVWRH